MQDILIVYDSKTGNTEHPFYPLSYLLFLFSFLHLLSVLLYSL